ncbi:MAG: nucleotidyltransferase family protein [Vicinamibacteria bacterium]|nr:nucleotidyltransferase family protein [Vicinamibacteria bacterium]
MNGIGLEPGTVEDLRGLAARRGIDAVRVFGSFARSEATAESDLDLLVRLRPGHGFTDFMAFCREAESLVGRRVDVLTEDGLSPFLRDRILGEAIPL